ncbi:MAG: helix-turn-helix domain-containing protein [Thermoleophilaceae bacterium]
MADSPNEPQEESPQGRSEPALAPTPLGEIIRRQRELSDLSMRHLARTVGISNPYLSQIERGLREPSERVLDAIAGALELSTEALYAEAGAAPEEERRTPAVVAAVRADPRLTARQRQAIIEVYEAFAQRRTR